MKRRTFLKWAGAALGTLGATQIVGFQKEKLKIAYLDIEDTGFQFIDIQNSVIWKDSAISGNLTKMPFPISRDRHPIGFQPIDPWPVHSLLT